jgi:hypothetical protein
LQLPFERAIDKLQSLVNKPVTAGQTARKRTLMHHAISDFNLKKLERALCRSRGVAHAMQEMIDDKSLPESDEATRRLAAQICRDQWILWDYVKLELQK